MCCLGVLDSRPTAGNPSQPTCSDGPEASKASYNSALYASGNNHAGTRFPVSCLVLDYLVDIAFLSSPWAAWTAIEAAIDLCTFDPVGYTGEPDNPAIVLAMRVARLRRIALDTARTHDVRVATLELLDWAGLVELEEFSALGHPIPGAARIPGVNVDPIVRFKKVANYS